MKFNSINLNSEEDLKIKVIIPYLKDLGFNFDELDFETSLSIRLGTKTYNIDEREVARGRIDILAKKDNCNLFVLEVKKDLNDIDNNDIEQAISYARLVHPIAPFAIISNGKSTVVYNAITKNELKNKNEIDKNCIFENNIDNDIKLKYEALKNFIGYSLNNVQLFTQGQIEQRMFPLIGDNKDLSKKFIPELFVIRKNLYIEFDSFLKSNDSCFAIIGESGVGKTNCICDLVNKYSKDNIVLFLNGTLLYGTLINNIKDDFNWVFSQHLETIEILKRLDGLSSKNIIKILIFIDAIDEVTTNNFELELNDIIQKLINFPKIKLCFTCKTYDWERFVNIKSQTSYTKEKLFKKTPFILDKFNNLELNEADSKYRETFKYSGILTENLKNEVELGIMLRILSEVYEGKELPDKFNELELFKEYLNKKLEKIDSETGYNILKEIGKIIIQYDTEYAWHKNTGIVDEDILRTKLSIPIRDKLFPELFSHNILIRHELENGKKYIAFYYNRFKNYVISVLSFNLPHLNQNEFKECLQILFKGQNGQESILWYIKIASSDHLQTIKSYYEMRAEQFIKSYNEILNKYFIQIKEKFDPSTSAEIGLLISDDVNFGMLSYAFRKIDVVKDKFVKVINKNDFKLDVLFKEYKVEFIKSSRYNFMTINPNKAAVEVILDQLEKIVEKEKLNENNNTDLALEKIQAILFFYSENFGLQKICYLYKIPYIKPLLPLNILDLSKKLQLKFAKSYIADERISEQIKNGKTQFHPQELKIILNEVDIENEALGLIRNNKDLLLGKKGVEATLYKYLNVILSNSDVISIPYLPFPDLDEKEAIESDYKISEYFKSLPKVYSLYSNEKLKEYVIKFFDFNSFSANNKFRLSL